MVRVLPEGCAPPPQPRGSGLAGLRETCAHFLLPPTWLLGPLRLTGPFPRVYPVWPEDCRWREKKAIYKMRQRGFTSFHFVSQMNPLMRGRIGQMGPMGIQSEMVASLWPRPSPNNPRQSVTEPHWLGARRAHCVLAWPLLHGHWAAHGGTGRCGARPRCGTARFSDLGQPSSGGRWISFIPPTVCMEGLLCARHL